jgi:Holliday junction resolvasome RuvABC endonuclease subunit
MRILGIDSSTTSTGYAILDDNKIISSGVIKPNKTLSSIERIIYIENEINALYDKYKPSFIVIEEMVAFRNANAMRILIGLIYHLVIEFTKKEALIVLARPSEWRKVCGVKGKNRNELKENAIKHIKDKYNKKVDTDEADAICIAKYGLSLEVEE